MELADLPVQLFDLRLMIERRGVFPLLKDLDHIRTRAVASTG